MVVVPIALPFGGVTVMALPLRTQYSRSDRLPSEIRMVEENRISVALSWWGVALSLSSVWGMDLRMSRSSFTYGEKFLGDRRRLRRSLLSSAVAIADEGWECERWE
jgi:hypothetical protein